MLLLCFDWFLPFEFMKKKGYSQLLFNTGEVSEKLLVAIISNDILNLE